MTYEQRTAELAEKATPWFSDHDAGQIRQQVEEILRDPAGTLESVRDILVDYSQDVVREWVADNLHLAKVRAVIAAARAAAETFEEWEMLLHVIRPTLSEAAGIAARATREALDALDAKVQE